MNKRIKIFLVFLGMVSLIAVGVAAWIYFTAQAEVAEYAKKQSKLEEENSYLQGKLDISQKEARLSQEEARHWREKSEAITAALSRLGQEHTLLTRVYDTLLKEKELLVEQNKGLSEQLEGVDRLYSRVQEKTELDTSDKFLASLLEEKVALEVKIEKLRGEIYSQEARLEDMKEQAAPFKRLQEEKETLEEKLGDAQKVSDILSNDLLQERKRKNALEQELAVIEEQLRNITEERDKISDQLVEIKQALERRLVELNQTKKVLESAVEGAKKMTREDVSASIQLPPIVVKADDEKPSLPKLSKAPEVEEEEPFELVGRIITVNDKHRFVVIDIGRDKNTRKGMSFDVYRKGEKVGRIEVIETRKNIAACDIKEMSVKHLKVDDTVRR